MNLKEYKAVLNNLERYNSLQEKNAALYCLDNEITAMKTAKLLGVNPSNEFEAIAFIFKLREISVSDLIDITHTCPECEYMSPQVISIPNMFFKDDDIHTDVPCGLFSSVDDLTEDDADNINIMSIPVYNEFEEKILINNLKIFDPVVTLICKKCNHNLKTSVIYSDIISKFSVTNIYEQYLDISQFSNMTKQDTDNMFPFEREIFLSLIQTKEDEKNKK